jgi:hypothetical protein
MVNKQGNIHILSDYQNVIYIDPNKIITNNGEVIDREVVPEDFVMYANLETTLVPRTKLLIGDNVDDPLKTIKIASLNFLKGTGDKDYLASTYYDEFTGKGSLVGEGANQKETFNAGDGNYGTFTQNVDDNGLLGIKKIDIKTNSSFVPTVTISMEDIQGRALFGLGNTSPYAAFFNLPYPPFYLTIKGYYGKAVRYQLVLVKFNASYNTTSGDYLVTLEFLGYKYNVLTDISIGHLLACPNMYSKKFDVSNNNPSSLTRSQITNIAQQTNGQTQVGNKEITTFTVNTHIGYQKILEVYKDYKSKKLIDANFPEMTLAELTYKLEQFEQNVLNSLNKIDVQKLTDGKNYRKVLNSYYLQVKGAPNSWYSQYIDPTPIAIANKPYFVYGLKKEILDTPTSGKIEESKTKLKELIDKFNKLLNENKTFGVNGVSSVGNNINYDMFIAENPNIDWCRTYKNRTANVFDNSLNELTEDFCESKLKNSILLEYTLNGVKEQTPIFTIDPFIAERNKMELYFITQLNAIEKQLSNELALKLENKKTGIGFKPTIKNIVAVILANTEGFLRLMEDVHTSAWNVRADSDRINAIGDADDNPEIPEEDRVVFPWPLVFTTNEKKDANKYELAYPGDPSVINKTKAYLANKWPEVEFVEEYINGYLKRVESPKRDEVFDLEDVKRKKYVYSAIEFPFLSEPFDLTSNVKFFFELWDRILLNSYYSGFGNIVNPQQNAIIQKLVQLNEFENIKNTIESNSIIFIQQLKKILESESGLNYGNYKLILEKISNKISEQYLRYLDGFPNEEYLNSVLKNTSEIFDVLEFKTKSDDFINNLSGNNIDEFKLVIQKAQDKDSINFTYPFTNTKWVSENMNNVLPNIYDTKNTIFFNEKRNVITNFKEFDGALVNKPFKFYTNNKSVLYGAIYQHNYSPNTQVKSLLNSPIFINAVQTGITKWRSGNKHPFVASAYLFLNTLPLSPLTDFLTTRGLNTKNGHIFSSFIKYSALHKLPYAWILKYGSIWHRYKQKESEGIDFLDEVWGNFDYRTNFNDNPNIDYVLSNGEEVSLNKNNKVSLGFYPKMLTDFNVFLNGYDLFTGFTSTEITKNQDRGLKVIKSQQYDKRGFKFNGYTVLVPKNLFDDATFADYCATNDPSKSFRYYILPSVNNNTLTSKSFSNTNDALYANSDELLSVAHNGATSIITQDEYNSFSFKDLKKPKHTEYVNTKKDLNSFSLIYSDDTNYASIEDIFGVFDYDTLNLFENEFLNFSKSIYEIDYKDKQIDVSTFSYRRPNADYRNFQLIFRDLMEVPSNQSALSDDEFYKQSANYQDKNISLFLYEFLNYDVLFKFGNPTQYNRYYYNSLISHLGGNSRIENFEIFKSYVSKSLPNNVSLVVSQNNNQSAWTALKLHVGFSTIDELVYDDNGSFITDFFIKNNIEFTSENVIALAKPIKIYATQRLKNPQFTKSQFLTLLDNNQRTLDKFVEGSLNGTLNLLQKQINNIVISENNVVQTGLEGKFSKYDLYESFKAINDKWIASSDYTNRTLFEDVLFLDRGARNIGDLYYADIFDLKKVFITSKVNLKLPVFNFIAGILVKNNFNVFPMPSYVNFYGALSPGDNVDDIKENATNTANDVWGNYSDVDYRKSGPKMVCVYAGKGSTTPKGNKDYRFADDSFDFLKPNTVPFTEDQTNKVDWSQSNKCVSFLVDAGVRNQAIFYGITVDQSNGSATLGSLMQTELLRNSVSNREVSTQNLSLFNLYKNLSYKATITCFGNALIQPTMYFNLQHIPMFGGPYFITEVGHSITPGSFETTFTGVRQSIYSLPSSDEFLTSINENLLTKIESNYSKALKRDALDVADSSEVNGIDQTNESDCSELLFADYEDFTQIDTTNIITSGATEMYKAINDLVADKNLADCIFIFSYLSSFKNNNFEGNHYNFGNVWLTYNRGTITSGNFFCAESLVNKRKKTPFAVFGSLEEYITYMASAISGICAIINEQGYRYDDIYIVEWLYPKDTLIYSKLKSEGNITKKLEGAVKLLKQLTPSEKFDEKQKEAYVDIINNAGTNKLLKYCDYVYNNIKITKKPLEPIFTFPYSLELFYESETPNELLYVDDMNKEIEKTLLKLYTFSGPPKVSKFEVKVISGTTNSISVKVDIVEAPDNIPYVGFKFIAESGSTANITYNIKDVDIIKSISENPNFSKNNPSNINNDIIGDVIKFNSANFNINYWGVNYSKLILYPKLR